MKPQSHTSSLGSGVELSERTTSSKVRSETVDSILSAVAKKKVVTSDKGTENFESGNTGTTSKPPSSKPPQFRCAVPWSITDSNSVNTTKNTHSQHPCAAPNNWCALSSQSSRSERSIEDQLAIPLGKGERVPALGSVRPLTSECPLERARGRSDGVLRMETFKDKGRLASPSKDDEECKGRRQPVLGWACAFGRGPGDV